MKEKFRLPEKWYVIARNDEQDRVIVDYMNTTFNLQIAPGLSMSMDQWIYSNFSITDGRYDKHDSGDSFYFKQHNPDSKEITYQQFVDYVLNPKEEVYEPDLNLELIYKKLLS